MGPVSSNTKTMCPTAFEKLHDYSEKTTNLFLKTAIKVALIIYSFIREVMSALYFGYEKIAQTLFYRHPSHRVVNKDWLVFHSESGKTGHAKGHVILIHGYLHDEGCWKHWVKELLDQGMNVYIPRLDRFHRHGIADYTSKVKSFIERDIEAPMRDGNFDQAPIHLIGHSMGGMVACDLARQKPKAFESLTSLGAPLHGALNLAKVLSFVHPCVDNMVPGHQYASDICAGLTASTAKKQFFSGEWDLIVPHPSALSETELASNIVVKYCGHMHLAIDEKVRQQAIKQIVEPTVGCV